MYDASERPLMPAAQYLRMSKDHQDYSIRNQARFIAAYARTNGYRIVRTYIDPGETGLTLRDRPGLQALLADVIKPACQFRRVLVLDVSRWGRFQNADQAAAYEFLCYEAGAPVHFCREVFENDDSPVMTLLKQFKRFQAAEFSRELSAKVLYAQLLQAKIGHKLGGPRRFGFERILVDENDQPIQKLEAGQTKALNNQRVVYAVGPDHEVQVIRDIFAWYTRDRLSIRAIAKRLNERGVPAGDGATWGETRIRLLLSDELVLGIYVFNRTTQKLKTKRRKNPPDALVKTKIFEPVISRALFESAARRRRIRRHHVPPEENLAAVARLYKSKGYLTSDLIDKCAYTPSSTVLLRQFGTIHRVYELVGYTPETWWMPRRSGRDPTTREELLVILRGAYEREGYVNEQMLNTDPALPSVAIYQRHFGKLTEAYRLAGLPYGRTQLQRLGHERLKLKRAGEPPRKISLPRWSELASRFSDDDLRECLRRMHREHGYVTAKIIRQDEYSPTPMVFIKRFGSLLNSYAAAGIENRRFNIWSRAAKARAVAKSSVRPSSQQIDAPPQPL